MSAIRISGLVKIYGWFLSKRKITAVDHLTLEVEEKQIYGFLGPNGAGKTTTIKILLGLVHQNAGEAYVLNEKAGDKNTKQRIGYLPDNPSFYQHLTGREFIAFCGKLMRIERMERYRRADELLDRMSLSEAADQKIEGYSLGMMQRIGIAQALINNPDLVIMDEPVSGLDPLGRREVKQILMNLRDEGKTIFFSSHILTDVEEMCNQVAILNRGHLLVNGPVTDLLEENGYRIRVSGLDAKKIGQTEIGRMPMSCENDHLIFDASGEEGRNIVKTTIEGLGGKIESISSRKETLEESFLRRVEADEKHLGEEE